jgi:phosphoglycolate phosphatase
MWKIPHPKDALIFDFDGVIADSLDFFYHSYNNVAKRVPVESITKQKARKLLSENSRRFVFPEANFLKKIYFFSQLISEMKENIDKIELVPGMKHTLENLFLENELYISSKNLPSVISNFLMKHGLRDYFSRIYSLGFFGKRSSFRHILKRHNRSRVLFITDTCSDILHARKLGIKALGCSWGLDSAQRLRKAKPLKVVRNRKQLLLAVREWKNK